MRLRNNTSQLLVKLTFLSSLFLSFLLVFSSCANTCNGFECQRGECVDGKCDCEDGWEGPSCNTTWADKFIGTYEGRDCYDSGNAVYSIFNTESPDTVIYDNKYKGYISNGDELVFPEQDAELDGAEFIFSGTGKLTTDGIDLLLFSKYKNPSFEVKCELSLTRSN